ncbi:MAG: sulfite dehydrogenase [Kiloniellales bacterium]|nr:sulfite dehydrogenase [Kiloniellales bacterium]
MTDRKPKASRLPASPERRRFLLAGAAGGGLASAGALVGAAAAASNPENLPPNVADWSRYLGSGVDAQPYGVPSEHEAHVIRRNVPWLTATPESSVNFTPLHELDGFVTPNGLCFERHHGGVAEIDPADHRLMIHGLVEKPLIFTMADIKRFPQENRFHFLECAANGGMEWRGAQLNGVQYTHGMVHCVQYTGVPLKLLLQEAGLRTSGTWILAEGADSAGMSRSIPIEKALDDCLVAYSMNGERLRPEQGYPLRLVVPGWEGNMWVKWLRRIEVGDAAWYHREETSKYTDLLPDGRAYKFTWTMEAKSVITSPCPEMPMTDTGAHVIKGLAWSGNGRIKRVDVSLDGGKNWRTARLHGPVLPKCLTRFTLDWVWDGKPALLQSRCIDETGYVQPEIAALQKVRGVNSIYHNHAIQTWLVNESGEVENVRLG